MKKRDNILRLKHRSETTFSITSRDKKLHKALEEMVKKVFGNCTVVKG